jgi:hypothetical protein
MAAAISCMRAVPADCLLIQPTENMPYTTASTPAPIASQSATSVDIKFPPS